MAEYIDKGWALATACSGFTREIEGERWIRVDEVRASLNAAPTIKAYTIEDLRDAYRDGQDNECSYHWGIRKSEPWYMKDEVKE